jgi:hypothetical protein
MFCAFTPARGRKSNASQSRSILVMQFVSGRLWTHLFFIRRLTGLLYVQYNLSQYRSYFCKGKDVQEICSVYLAESKKDNNPLFIISAYTSE